MNKPKMVRKPKWVSTILVVLLFLAAAASFAYPVVATQFNNHRQREHAARYHQITTDIAPQTLSDAFEEALEYNQSLDGIPILDPYLTTVSNKDDGGYSHYLTLLDDTEAMGRLQVPSLNIDMPIYHGTDDRTITMGVGHLYGTALPVGGESTHAVLTSHRAMPQATLFDRLPDIEDGALILVSVAGQHLAYEVHHTEVIEPDDTELLHRVDGKDLLTLFTCHPYAINTHRFVVTAHRVSVPTEVAEELSGNTFDPFDLEPWMRKNLLYAGIGGLLALLMLANEARVDRKWRKNRRKRAERLAREADTVEA